MHGRATVAETLAASAALRHRLPDRLDWYALRSLFGPLLLCLCVLLLAMLLQWSLRLFDMAASTGAGMLLVLKMIASRVPHYLGMAVPAAFFAAIFMAVARTGDDNELDAMLATGRSITRMAAPFFLVAMALCAFNLYLFGYLQPVTRYGFELNVYQAKQTGWSGRVEDNSFVTARQGITMGADSVGGDGRTLAKVFVQRSQDSREEIIAAERGRLVPSADGRRLLLELENGMIVRDQPTGSVLISRCVGASINEDFTAVPPPFRARGKLRELTLPELGRHGGQRNSGLTAAQLGGELHGRVAWVLLPLLLPLLALPLGMAAKRGRRAPGTVFATLALLVLWQALQFGESLAEAGRAPAWLSVWLPMLVFAVFGLWLFRSSLQWPGDNPVMRSVSAIEALFEGLQRKKKVPVA
jgi:lipopolysaccharide export system permease protein